MSSRDRVSSQLPDTAEVGSEGGSHADSRNQAATFSGPANPTVSPADAAASRMPVVTEAAPRGPLAGPSPEGAENDTPGMIRYPTEPPSTPDARQGRKMTAHAWRSGLIGLAAGTAALLGFSRLRRRT